MSVSAASVTSSRRVLVTGGEGFVARHLGEVLRGAGHAVAFSVRRKRRQRLPSTDTVFELDLPDRGGARDLLAELRPDVVVHLAARSHVRDVEADPGAAVLANVAGTRSLLEALEEADPERRCSLVLASTAHVYRPPCASRGAGDSQGSAAVALEEDAPLGPRSAYGKTKLAAELVAGCLTEGGAEGGAEGGRAPRPLIIFRCFNHSGPGQSPRFALGSFAMQFARVERGIQEPVIETGDLEVERDFTDVRDVVRAYGLAVSGAVPSGVYNVASGAVVSLREIIEVFRRLATRDVEIRSLQRRRRAGELRALCGSPEQLRRVCGWRAEIPLERTLQDMLSWCRHEVESGGVMSR